MHILFFLVIIVLLIILLSKSGAKNIANESFLRKIQELQNEIIALSAKLDFLQPEKKEDQKAEEKLSEQSEGKIHRRESYHLLSIENNTILSNATAQSNFKNWLWPVIIFILIVLGIFTFRLAKEVERKK